jgi:hypothetical protein
MNGPLATPGDLAQRAAEERKAGFSCRVNGSGRVLEPGEGMGESF